MSIMKFSDEEEALTRANNTEYAPLPLQRTSLTVKGNSG